MSEDNPHISESNSAATIGATCKYIAKPGSDRCEIF